MQYRKFGRQNWDISEIGFGACAKQAELNSSASDGKLLEESELKELGQFYWRKDFWREEIEI